MLLKDFMLAQLANIWPKKVSDKQVLLCCPFHNETKPSLSLSLVDGKVPAGVFHCFGCAENGHWNKLAQELGLDLIDSKNVSVGDQFSTLYKVFKADVKPNSVVYKLPEQLFEWDKPRWRGLKLEFLKQFQPAKQLDTNWMEWRIFFPILFFNKLVGHLSEKINNTDNAPKHLFSTNLPVKNILYPVDLHKGSTVVLTEGVLDMLRLLRDGIPALCFFGTSNWQANKKYILMKLGIENIIACGDGDVPGWNINETIKHDLRNDFNVKVFDIPRRRHEITDFTQDQLITFIKRWKLPLTGLHQMEVSVLFSKTIAILDKLKGYDPGNMPNMYIKQLKTMVSSF